MTQEQQEKLRKALYNAKFTTDAEDEDPFVGVYFNDLLDIIEDYVEQPLIDKACEFIRLYIGVDIPVRLTPDGEPLAEDFINKAEARCKAADRVVEQFKQFMEK